MAGKAGIRYQITGDVGPGLSALRGFQSSWGAMVGAFATGQAAFAAVRGSIAQVGAAFQGVRSAFDLGGTLSDMSSRTGIAVKDLMVLRKAFKDAGIGAESVGPIVNVMQRSLAGLSESGESTAGIFAALGLSMDELRGMSTSDQLTKIGKAINGLQDPAQRSAAAMKIFGRSGGEMLTLFADEGVMKAAGQTLGKQADILGRQAGTFDRISDLMGSAGEKLQGLFVGIADKMAGPLLSVLESLNKIDLSGIGQQIGDVIGRLMRAFQQGKLGELIGESLKTGLAKAGNFLVAVLKGASEGLAGYWQNIPKMLQAAFGLITNPKFWTGIADIAIGALGGLAVKLIEIFQAPIAVLQAGLQKAGQEFMAMLGRIPKIGKWLGLDGFKAESFDAIFAKVKEQGALGFDPEQFKAMSQVAGNMMSHGASAIREAGAGVADTAQVAGQTIVDGFKSGFNSAEKVFDESSKKMDQVWTKLDAPKSKPAASPATATPAPAMALNLSALGSGGKGKGAAGAGAGESTSTNWKDIFGQSIQQAELSGEKLSSDRRGELMRSAIDLSKKNKRIGKAREKYGVDAPAEGAAAAAAAPAAGAAAAAAGTSSGGGVEVLLKSILTKLDGMASTLQEATA